MNWFIWALLCPVCWSFSNLIDQFMARDYFKNNITAYAVMMGLSSLPFLLVFAVLVPAVLHIDMASLSLLLFSSLIYMLALYPYMTALQRDDVSVVIPVFQLIPFIVTLLCFVIFHEKLHQLEIITGAGILSAAIALSWDFERGRLQILTLFNAGLATLCFAVNAVLLRYWTAHLPSLTVAFWHLTGWSVFGLAAMVFIPSARQHVCHLFRQTGGRIYVWSALQDGMDILATICLTLALSQAPAAGLVSLVGTLHPALIFISGGVLAQFYPTLFERAAYDRKTLLKIVCVVIMLIGCVSLYYFSGVNS